MSNTNIGGFRFVRTANGAKEPAYEEGYVATANDLAIFKGDAVCYTSAGVFTTCGAGGSAYGIMDGVVQYKGSDGVMRSGGNYLPASTSYTGGVGGPDASKIRVIPVRDNVFEVDVAVACGSLAAAYGMIGNNNDFVTGSGGSTVTGTSSYGVANTSGFGTSTANCRLIGFASDPLNDVTSTYWKALVEFNEGAQPSPTTSTGT